MKAVRTLLLLACGLGLLTLAGFALTGSVLALPAAVAGASSLVLALG
jgi:hypothetical protein